MSEYTAIAVIFYRIKDGKYYFYLTKTGPNLPIMPSYWTPVGDVITQEDRELYSELRNKFGDIAPNMLKRVAALRIVFERNLFDTEKIVEVDIEENVYEIISKIDQEILNVWFHSMIPCGFQCFHSGENIFNTYYFLFITPSNPTLRNVKLKRASVVFDSPSIVLEERAKWIETKRISSQYHNLDKVFPPIFTSFVEKLTREYKKPFEITRELEQRVEDAPCRNNHILPYTWRFSAPTPLLPPYDTTNIYVIGNEKKYIIDPGSAEFKAIEDLIKFIENNKATMEGILLTNPYPDHCNQAQHLSKAFDLPLSTSEVNAKILEKEGLVFSAILKEGTKILLGTNPELGIEDWNLETIELPGSCKGAIGFWDSRGLLFSGTTLHKDLTITNDIYPEAYSELTYSLNKIKKFNPKLALSGHGLIITEVNKTIKQNKKSLIKIEKTILKALKQGISEIDELTDMIISERTSSWRIYMKRLANSALEKLVEEGKITKIATDYIWRKNKKSHWK